MELIKAKPFLHFPSLGSFSVEFFLKDAMDRIGALCALILLSPVFLILIPKIRKDGGPAFFGHTRIGKNGKAFKCWKFRTMVTNGSEVLKNHLAANPEALAEWERDYKLKDDPRVTKVGKFLRKSSIDEIPQLWNVLVGDMSLVGPRPIIKDERKFYAERFQDYIKVKPGITGLWQVSGRNWTTFEERIELNTRYVREWSLWNDIKILFKTVHVVATGHGAY